MVLMLLTNGDLNLCHAVKQKGVEPAMAERKKHHLHMPGQAKRLGQIAVDSSARGFGWVLGGDAANSLFHSLT